MSPRSRELRSLAVRACFALALIGSASMVGCGQQLDVGSDVLWTARFENGDLSEWMSVSGGGAVAFPAPNAVDVSSDQARRGKYAARLAIQTASDGSQANAGLSRTGFLPVEAYYSAWYYLPSAVNVSTFWVIFKFRMRSVADDASTAAELFDLNLANTSSGGMTLRLYDHRGGDIPLDVAEPTVPVGTWFQVEAYYLNPGSNPGTTAGADGDGTDGSAADGGAPNDGGRLTFWLDGQEIVDVTGPMAPTSWVAWDVVSVAVNLTPSTAVLYVDDCAISRTRVGPHGIIAASSN
jgi:hypothetical protein